MGESNSVFISYRRSVGGPLALAVWQDLYYHNIDALYDIESAGSGRWLEAILGQIAARPYFMPILTPGTLDRCREPGDVLLREFQEAVRLGRVIVPLFTPEFRWSDVETYLPAYMARALREYNGVELAHRYFKYAMQEVRERFLRPISIKVAPTPEIDVPIIEARQAEAAAAPAVTERQLTAQEYLERALARPESDLGGRIADYSRAIALHPEYAAVYNIRGDAYLDQGNPDKALADFNKALELDPDNADYYHNRARTRQKKGELDRAISDYGHAIRLNPRFAEAYHHRGQARYQKGDVNGAIADYSEAIRLNPLFDRAFSSRGEAHYKKGNLEDALADYSQVIRLQPQQAEPYRHRGLAYQAGGKLEQAIGEYTEAIRLNPDFASAYNNRANARKDSGDWEGAIADYTEAIRLNPDFANAYYNRSIALATLERFGEAIEDIQKFLDLAPGDPASETARNRIAQWKRISS